MEIWEKINVSNADFNGAYYVSSLGRIIHAPTFRIHRQSKNSRGYIVVKLFNNGNRFAFQAHRLVAGAFIPNENNFPEVNHKNCDKTDNRVENLEWCTSSFNVKHSYAFRKKNNTYNTERFSLGSNPKAKKVINTGTGEIYGSMTEAANSIGMDVRSFQKRLQGVVFNNTDFIYFNI